MNMTEQLGSPSPDIGDAAHERALAGLDIIRADGVPAIAAYVSGSQFAGLGSPTSDVDLFVVLEQGPVPDTRQVVVGADRVDVEFLPVAQLDALVQRAWDPAPASDEPVVAGDGAKWFDPAVRFLIGTDVMGTDLLRERRDALAAHLPSIRRSLLQWTTAAMLQIAEDHAGFRATDDRYGMLHCSQRVLISALDMLAQAAGDLYRNDKWVPPRLLRRTDDSGAASCLLDLALAPHETPAIGLIEARMLTAQRATAMGWVQGWQGVRTATVPGIVGREAPRGPIMAPDLIPIRFGDQVILSNALDATRSIAVSVQGMCLWASCVGQPRQETVHAATTWLSTLGYDVPTGDVDAYLDQLIEQAAVTA